MSKEFFNITGMTCASCSARVERTISSLEGVANASVNLLTNSMEVEFNENKINTEAIISAVENAGYGASIKNQNPQKYNTPKIRNDDTKNAKLKLIWSFVFLAPLFYISMGHMMGWYLPDFIHGSGNELILAFTEFLFTIPIVFINFNYFKNGFKNLFRLSPNMDSLIAIGSATAIIYGVFAIYRISWGYGHNENELITRYAMDLYFESAGTILTLITLGKFLESRAKLKTTDAITRLINLQPQTAIVIRNGKTIEIPIEQVVEGDIISVKNGNTIPVDGIIVKGNCTIDESIITGESLPIEKNVGDTVIGATLNNSGYIEIKATKVGENSTLSQIIKLVEEASATKAPVAKIADKISGVFVPIVIGISFISTIVWLLLGYGTEFSISIGIAVLVISCPCALGLATPTAIMTGTGRGAQMGILIKSAEALETAGKIDTVVLDKTGTITEGKPYVTDIKTFLVEENHLLEVAVAVEKLSEHPLAKSVVEYCEQHSINSVLVDDFTNYSGMGISAKTQSGTVLAGNIKLMEKNGISTKEYLDMLSELSSQGKTPLFFAENNSIIGIIAVADIIKNSSKIAVKELNGMGIDVVMLTGDNKVTAKAIAKSCGIKNVVAEVMPQDKEAEIRKLQNQKKYIAMVGDGINDAPALARANVGIAIGAGTDIAIDSADVVLVKNSLIDIVKLIQLSRKTIKNIKENLFWALIYNLLGIPLAAGLFYIALGWKLNPMYGAAAMCVSSVCVVTNALRLRTFKPKFKYYNGSSHQVKTLDYENNNTDFIQREEETIMTKKVIIDGMMCTHCSGRVEQVLNAIEGVSAVVNLEEKCATVTGNVSDEVITQTIKDAGYTVVEIK